jgi:hypothetical protein
MRARVRIPAALYAAALADLKRPHAFAAERVGFMSAKVGNRSGEPLLVLATGYEPVDDGHYVEDEYVGARINADAIRANMQRILDTGEGSFHVHLHPHRGAPRLSRTDRREIPRLVESFRPVGPDAAHGIIVLSEDRALGVVLRPGEPEPVEAEEIAVVGWPLRFLGGEDDDD